MTAVHSASACSDSRGLLYGLSNLVLHHDFLQRAPWQTDKGTETKNGEIGLEKPIPNFFNQGGSAMSTG
jgi:hypothetical protein